MTRLVSVKQHVRTVQAPSPKTRALHECMVAELCRRMMPELIRALEEAFADWRPEEA